MLLLIVFCMTTSTAKEGHVSKKRLSNSGKKGFVLPQNWFMLTNVSIYSIIVLVVPPECSNSFANRNKVEYSQGCVKMESTITETRANFVII